MPIKPISIVPPVRGLSDDTSYTRQPTGSTREALNVRARDPKTGRERISQRSGLSLFIDPDTQLNGSNKVADMVTIAKNEDLLTWADDDSGGGSGPGNVFAKRLPGPSNTAGDGDCVDMRMDDYGDLYVAQRVTGVYKYNRDGQKLAEILVPEAEPSSGRLEVVAFDVDEFGNVAVAMGGSGSTTAAACRLHFFVSQSDGTYRRAWSLDTGNAFMDVAFYQGDIYTLEADDIAGQSGLTAYFRVYRDYGLVTAPPEDEDSRVDITTNTATDCFGTRMAVRDDGVVYITGTDDSTNTANVVTFLLKVNPNGATPTTPVWKLLVDGTDDVSGLGFCVAMGPRNSNGEWTVYTYGPRGNSATDNGEARRIVDQQTSANIAGGDAWVANITQPLANPVSTRFMRMGVDTDGHLYICVPTTSGNDVEILQASDGSALRSFTETNGDAVNGGTCVAVDTGDKPKGSSSEEVEFVFYGMRESVTNKYAFFKQRMLKITQSTGAMRSQLMLGVAGGNIVKFTASGVTTPTGGSSAIDTNAPFVQSVTFGDRVLFTDGKDYKQYKVDDDKVEDLVSKTSAVIPPRCRLIETWRGRVVLGRDPEDPQLWHMSAVGNAEDWDTAPAVASVTQAISGVSAKAGKVPDIVNAIIPWDDDLCLFGGSSSIWRLTGDPLAGGQFDLVTDETGIAFGRCWVKDPNGGRLFFIGSRGGVYMMSPGSLPVRISKDWIERRLQAVDFENYYLRLVWNYRDEGLHIIQCPFGDGGTTIKHWFWDAKQGVKTGGGWWEDQFGSTALGQEVQPTSVLLVDGDQADDRRILFGCEDGRIRVWDEDYASDQATTSTNYPVLAKVVYGPLLPANLDREYAFMQFTGVLARDQNGCSFQFYGPDEGDVLGPRLHSGTLMPGRNNGDPGRFCTSNAFLKLTNTMEGQRFSVESMLIHAAAAGKVRVR